MACCWWWTAHDGPQAQTQFVLRKALENRREADRCHQQDRPRKRAPAQSAGHGFRSLRRTERDRRAARFPGHLRQREARLRHARDSTRTNDRHGAALSRRSCNIFRRRRRSSEPYFQMLVSNLDYSDYLGRIAFGRIVSGRVAVGDSIVCIHTDGRRERANVTALFSHSGLGADRNQARQRRRHRRPGRFRGSRISAKPSPTAKSGRRCRSSISIRRRSRCNSWSTIRRSPGAKANSVTARHIRERLVRETRTQRLTPGSPTPKRRRVRDQVRAAKCRSRSSSSRCDAKASS